MARNQKNFDLFTYVDSLSGRSWNVRGETGGAAAAVDGHANWAAGQPRWPRQSRRMHVRKILYQDSGTFRTISPIFYTQAAYDAVALGDTLAVSVAGDALTVDYFAIEKLPEKQPRAASSRKLADS